MWTKQIVKGQNLEGAIQYTVSTKSLRLKQKHLTKKSFRRQQSTLYVKNIFSRHSFEIATILALCVGQRCLSGS